MTKLTLIGVARSKARGAFTLIELLFVCGIIGIIATLAIVSFTHINRGANLKSAERQILGATFLARQTAVNTRQKVMIAVPYYVYTGVPNNYVRPNMLYASYMYMAQETSGVARPESIIGKVEPLPKSVVFNEASFNGWTDYTVLNAKGQAIFKVKGFRYSPNGGVYWQDADAMGGVGEFNFILTEGTIVGTNTSPRLKLNGLTSTASVSVASGRCSILGPRNQY